MLNVLGDAWFREGSTAVEPDWDAVRHIPQTTVHLYGKSDPRPGRKMAHVTCLGATLEEARDRARQVALRLGLETGGALDDA
jgi:5-(carboxyamino)imidazole ribonucleotide synthase